jgi:hypothetical protein
MGAGDVIETRAYWRFQGVVSALFASGHARGEAASWVAFAAFAVKTDLHDFDFIEQYQGRQTD